MSKFKSDLIAVALSQVGVRESGGNNCGEIVRKYQSATWFRPDAWPWCAAFICWCLLQVSRGPFDGYTRLRTPRAVDLITWGKVNELFVDYSPDSIKAGDLIVYDFESGYHCGIAVADSTGGFVDVVEGNTEGQGQSRDGGGVYRMTRKVSLVFALIRLR